MHAPRTIRAADCRVMPWKNGQGTTTELAVEPEGAALDAFEWRISIAELRGGGPFSTFPGYDRILTQLDGRPMALSHAGRPPVVLEALVPHSFSGDEETDCTLDGIAHDFNVIARRGAVSAAVTAVRLGEGDELAPRDSGTVVVHVLAGELRFADGTGLRPGDSRLGPGGVWSRAEAFAVATVLVVEIERSDESSAVDSRHR